jgi:NMD protein affecting ribosome stability and mRNA decay
MKTNKSIELYELCEGDLVELNGGSIFTWITEKYNQFVSSQGKAYEEMHDAGLLAYRH